MALIIKFPACARCPLVRPILTLPFVTLTTVGPTNVEILNQREPLSAGKRYEVKCQSIGARPPPTVTWWLGGKQVCLLLYDQHKPAYLLVLHTGYDFFLLDCVSFL